MDKIKRYYTNVNILDDGLYLNDYSVWDNFFKLTSSFTAFDVFISTHNKALLYKSALWSYLNQHILIARVEVIEIDIAVVADQFLKKMMLSTACENLRYLHAVNSTRKYNYYFSISVGTELDSHISDAFDKFHCNDALAIFYSRFKHHESSIPYIPTLDFFSSNDSVTFSNMQNILYYTKAFFGSETHSWKNVVRVNDKLLDLHKTHLLCTNNAIAHLAKISYVRSKAT